MLNRKVELTTVVELIEELKQLNPKAKVYVAGEYGYMHIRTDADGEYVTFDDALDECYEEGDEE